MKNQKICAICGEVLNEEEMEVHEVNGEYYCEECFYDNFEYCSECGEIISRDNSYYIDSEDIVVCENCLDNNFIECHDCGEYFRSGNGYSINDGDGDYYDICNCCFDNGYYYYCNDCGDYFHENNMHFTDDDECYCDDCYENHATEIYSYHDFDDWQLFKGKNEIEPPYYIGKEIELDPLGNENAKDLLKIININGVPMHDGSLLSQGVEVVTHPESWQYLQENKGMYIKFFEEVEKINYGNDGRCGLHFHVSRPNNDIIARIIVILESFKDEIKKLSRREERQMHWASFYSDTQSDTKEKIKYQSTKYLKDKFISRGHDRYYALNLANANTIEFRFFNGVNNFEEFWGALQFIHNVMEIALDESKEINTINWKDLLDGKELQEQARKTGVIEIDKFAKDTSDILEKYEAIVEKTRSEIKNILKNMAKYINKEMSELELKRIRDNDLNNMYEKCDNFIDDFRHRLQYLSKIVSLYNSLNDSYSNSLQQVKDYWNSIKINYPVNTERYKRYNKLMEKAFKNYDKEVM